MVLNSIIIQNHRVIGSSESVKKSSNSSSNILNDIIQEYCLKRNQFNPNKASPNKFVNKLHMRMKIYYNKLYSVKDSNKY